MEENSKDLDSWFIRHKLSISDEDIKKLFRLEKIAIHFPQYSIDEDKEPTNHFNKLSSEGGYVWADYRNQDEALVGTLVGKIQPGTQIKMVDAWNANRDEKWKGKEGLKTLQMKKVKKIAPNKEMVLRCCRPPGKTISPWYKPGDKLKAIVEGKELKQDWSHLPPPQQEIASAEFLRHHSHKEIPKLKYLILRPGGNLEDIDICGIAETNKTIFGQVTYSKKDNAGEKIEKLEKYANNDSELLFFCRCESLHKENKVLFVPVDLVSKWLDESPRYKYKELLFH